MANMEIPGDKREFRCNHCNGKILIPRNLPQTTGPCPHCSGVITSPPPDLGGMPLVQSIPVTVQVPTPAPAPVQVPVQAQAPVPAPIPAPTPAPLPSVPPVSSGPPVPIAAAPAPAPAPPPRENSPIASEPVSSPAPAPANPGVRPAVIPPPREKPLQAAPVSLSEPPPHPAAAAPAAAPAKQSIEIPHAADPSHANKRKHKNADPDGAPRKKSSLIPAMLILLLLVAGAGAAFFFVATEMRDKAANALKPPTPITAPDPSAKEANYIRIGWQKDAYQLLGDYMNATTSAGKLPFILNGDSLGTRLEDFYGGGVINDTDTPAEAFSIYELSEEDRKRGLFMMIYDQPPQFEMKEFFRPLASLEVQYGIDEADLLLSTLARVGNFAMEPLRVHAFFKRTPEGLKLDWEIFAQTKYRTFQNFVELPETGQVGTFRVFIVEDVPDKTRLEAGTRTYRMADPANTSDTARVNVKVDSEIGRALSIINWRGAKESRPITRTATVELKWTGDAASPDLEISRFICWEFLGLGGQETPSTASTQ